MGFRPLALAATLLVVFAAGCVRASTEDARFQNASLSVEQQEACALYLDALVRLEIMAGAGMYERLEPDGPEELFHTIEGYIEDVRGAELEELVPLRERLVADTAELSAKYAERKAIDDILRDSELIDRWSADLDDYTTEIKRNVDVICPRE